MSIKVLLQLVTLSIADFKSFRSSWIKELCADLYKPVVELIYTVVIVQYLLKFNRNW